MLRRRKWFRRKHESTRDSSPSTPQESESIEGEEQVVPVVLSVEKKHHHKHSLFASRRFLFPLGLFLGVFIGFILISPTTTTYDLPAQFSLLLQQYDFPSLVDGLKMLDVDWTRLEVEWQNIKNMIPEPWKLANDGREFQVGEQMKARGLSAKYPVILVPGVISTSLESWSTSPEYRPYFREKLWGGLQMVSQVTFNRERWISSLMLDLETGLDPPGVKVRAAQGLDAASSFVQGYWVWAKIIENLAVVNYDTANNLILAAYDWRLSYNNLEVRDAYFSRLKMTIEGLKKRHDKKVVFVAHSMGSTVVLYFFKWVESPMHGGGGPSWVENHIEAFVSIAGTMLGVPKALTAFLSGEMKDTVELNPAGAYVLEQFFSRNERAKLFRSWGGSASMWVKGGNAIWGNGTHAPDDPSNCTQSHGRFLSFRPENALEHRHRHPENNQASSDDIKECRNETDSAAGSEEDCSDVIVAQSHNLHRSDNRTSADTGVGNMTVEEATEWILQHTPASFQTMLETNYSVGIERQEEVLDRNNFDPKTWTNPLESRLPIAPSLKIYCVYGHGKDTERSYWYARGPYEHAGSSADTKCVDDTDAEECRQLTANGTVDSMPLPRKNWIDAEINEAESWPKVRNGVKMGEGDGTVSLLSLGSMCVEGWKRPRWNPAGVNVTTIELPHRPTSTILRGGANTSDHIDILGSTALNEVILKVATGVGDEVEESITSNIREYVQRMQWD